MYGEKGRDREGGGQKKALVKGFQSVLQGNVCMLMHVPARAHRQADPDVTFKAK